MTPINKKWQSYLYYNFQTQRPYKVLEIKIKGNLIISSSSTVCHQFPEIETKQLQCPLMPWDVENMLETSCQLNTAGTK